MKNKQETIIILDRSGSMTSIKDDMEGQLKVLLKAQREESPNSTVSVYTFDDKFDILFENKDIKSVDTVTIQPRNMTALYDAIGKAMALSSNRKAKRKLVIIVTDGQENASTEYKSTDIQKIISDCKEKNYEFIFLGANQDVWKTSKTLGIDYDKSIRFNPNSKSLLSMNSTLDAKLRSYYSGKEFSAFTVSERG